ncbi:hypothetical protein [Halomonas daqiaonensis]|uniref:Uncharacterized protein n=1 Tax=Halomonas daqiaonensis TaxID=650850 RepID=A0A1H7H1W9_9GAMM|nr:hypothetical protein [Halomonas daqiaonensis]SEK44416.1 hypothetical protein SAMN04488129_102123 [Halomonas daqiaonensis]
MRWLAVILASALPLTAVGDDLPHSTPYPYSADPLTERERARQAPRLFWTAAQRLDHSASRVSSETSWVSREEGRLMLDAGEEATFELAAQGHLRLQLEDDQAPPLLWLSHDGQLWWQASWTPGTDGQEWFHVKDKPSPLLARLEAETDFSGRLLVAELDPVDSPDAYRETAEQRGLERVQLVDDDGDRLPVQRLSRGETLELDVKGPVVLALASRPAEEAKQQQQYSLSWTLDEAPWQQVSIERTQLSTLYQEVDASLLHGGMDRRYLTIPEGEHRLRLKASLPLLARIEQTGGDYFLALNEPEPTAAELTRSLVDQPLTAGGMTLDDVDALRQSNHLEGAADIALGFLGLGFMEQDASSWPGARPQVARQALAGDIERSQRFFRNLFPDAATDPLALTTAWFATTSPLQLEADEDYYLGQNVLERLGRGLFVELDQAPLNYPLPARFGPSRLRLSVARLNPTKDTELWVQYDDAPAKRLRLTDAAPQVDLPTPEDAVLSQGQAWAHAQGQVQGSSLVHPTLGGDFTAQREAGHYWPTASVTLPLPTHVDEVRVWSDAVLPVSLQYRASQPYEAGETTYRDLLEETPSHSLVNRLRQALEAAPNPESKPLPFALTPERALENQWYPMLRYLHAAQAAYLDDLDPKPYEPAVAHLDERLKRARAQSQRTNWIGVLEALGRAGYGQDPEAYRLSQKALEALGEHYLARRQRLATAVFAPDAVARRLATEDLLTDFAKTQRWESQVRLLAARYLREGDRALLDPLGEALHRAGDSLWATQLGLVLAHQGPMPDWLPEAAQEAGWLDTADRVPDQALRQGDLAARQGDTAQAMQYWLSAGEAGLWRMERMREAEDIALALESSDRDRRLAGVERWLAWSLSPQQAFDWVSLGSRFESSQGFSTLFSDVTRKPLALPHASAEAPLELEVVGPTVLRVQLRRVAPDSRAPGEMDWLAAELVNAVGKTTRLQAPILSRADNPYLETINRNIGTATGDDILLEVPAGLYQVRLRPQDHDYLTQLWQWQPTQHWAVLPALTPLALKDLLQDPDDRTGFLSASAPEYHRVREGELERLPVLPAARLHTLDLVPLNAFSFMDALESLEFPDHAVGPKGWPEGSHAVQVEDVATDTGVPELPDVAHGVAVALLWQLEQNPGNRERVSARLAQLAEAHSAVPAIRQLADRLLQSYDWEPISSSFESAGVRQLPLQEEMHSPFRRVRQALLPQLPASAMLLSGRGTEGVELFTPDPLTIEIRLAQRVLPHEARVPAEVMLQLDDRQPRMVRLSEKESVVRLRLEAGEHALRLWLREPRQQQFVTARINRAENGASLLDNETRTYHIAAPDQPASFYVQGPAWVRVDEWQPGNRSDNGSTQYRYVDAGWQTLIFEAGDGEDRYYRLHALHQSPEARPLEPAMIKASLAAPATGPTPPEAPVEPVAWRPEDRHHAGADLSSWGGYLDLVDRVSGSEEDVAPAQGASVMEAGVSYRFRQQDRRFFSRSDMLLRRFDGQEVLGARQWVDVYPEESDWQLGFFGEAYLQPGEVQDLDGDNHWSARVQTSLERTYRLSPRLRHEPGITLNQRWLSLDSVPGTALPELDPDVFSPYKRDHRRSLVLADRLTWTPHLDQRVYLEGALVSNESLNPFDLDHLEVTAAARQLFGSAAGEVGVRWRRYFNDDDRTTSLDRKRVFLGGNLLSFDAGANALTLRAEANYDIDRSDVGWRLRIGYEANAGRLSPARRPDELDFLPLRRAQQRARVDTNRLDPVYP